MLLAREMQAIRSGVGRALFGMVAGPDGPDNRARIHGTPGPRWFADDRPIRRVHADASMFVGGLRALLLQSLHPLAMAGVAEHSDYRGDPWGRLQRTSTFLAVTTFGPAADAQRALGTPLTYVSGRPGNEIFLTFRDIGGSGLFQHHDRLYLQFRKGRLAGWKGDWGENWMWR